MSVNFNALGGLFTFKYINDVEDMDLDDLQEMYADMEEEFHVIEKDYKEGKEELGKLREVIDRKSPEEKREKKRKKPKTAKEILGDKDIPYEVRMKYIIDAYRKDQEKWGKLEAYAKHLEAEVARLKNILTVNGYADTGNPEDAKPAKVISELQAKVAEQEKKMKTLARDLRDSEIKRLKKLIKKEYPLRAVKLKKIRNVVRAQKEYIEELQALLEKNDIVYWPMEPADEKDIVEVENAIDIINAVRVPQDLEQIPKINKVEI